MKVLTVHEMLRRIQELLHAMDTDGSLRGARADVLSIMVLIEDEDIAQVRLISVLDTPEHA